MILERADAVLDGALFKNAELMGEVTRQCAMLREQGMDRDALADVIAGVLVQSGEELCRDVIAAG